MPFVEKIKSVIGSTEEDRQYKHQCGDCESEFESPHQNPNEVSCPECGSTRVHTAV